MKTEKTKKLTKFKIFLIAYTIFLAILMLLFLGYISQSLIKYEKNQVENYLERQIKDLKIKSTNNQLEIIGLENIKTSKFEKEEINAIEILKELLTTKNITYKQKENNLEEDKPIFIIYADDTPILEMTLDGTKKEHRLGLLTYSIWETIKIENKLEEGIYNYKIIIPNTYQAFVNNQLLTEEEKIKQEENIVLQEILKFTNIPYNIIYEIKGFYKKPEIKVIDENNREIIYEETDNVVLKEVEYVKIANKKDALKEIKDAPDILKIAEDWSLYLTDDLGGTLHGYHTIKNYLMEDSELLKFAYKWATNIDITFISNHTLEKEVFTNERIENFEIYSEDAFSCEVYLEKNMNVKGNAHQDIMHDKMYFVYKDNAWKLVNMASITKGENEK